MSSAWNPVYAFAADVGNKIHDLNADSLNFWLTNTAPTTATTAYVSADDLATGNGYTAGGQAIASNAFAQVSGTATLTGSNVVWTATGAVGPFRYTPLYNNTAAGKNALGWYDYGASVSLSTSETFTINIASGVFQIVA
ncbi:MAG: hypothetical protein ACYDCP_09985 [Thermoplasmataceae archaeon]